MSYRAKRGIYCLSLAALLCAFAAPAPAAGETEAHFHWQLGFGAGALETGYGVSLGYAGGEHFAPLSRVVEMNVTPRAALATVAGLPLFTRTYRANQSQADQAYDAGVADKPWYARGWVLWTAGGLAVTAALIGTAASASSTEQHNGQATGNTGVSTFNFDNGSGTVCPAGQVPDASGICVPVNGG